MSIYELYDPNPRTSEEEEAYWEEYERRLKEHRQRMTRMKRCPACGRMYDPALDQTYFASAKSVRCVICEHDRYSR